MFWLVDAWVPAESRHVKLHSLHLKELVPGDLIVNDGRITCRILLSMVVSDVDGWYEISTLGMDYGLLTCAHPPLCRFTVLK